MVKQHRARLCISRLAFHISCLILLTGGLSSCGTSTASSPTTTTGGAPRYDGQWKGTTAQGTPITFSVSADQKVTAITVGYSFNGCSGVNTFSSLNLDIGNPPNPAALTLGPGFGYGSGAPDGPNYTQVYGSFTSNTTAAGSVVFGAYPGCGNGGGFWTATKN
jgi:hypothetical protein